MDWLFNTKLRLQAVSTQVYDSNKFLISNRDERCTPHCDLNPCFHRPKIDCGSPNPFNFQRDKIAVHHGSFNRLIPVSKHGRRLLSEFCKGILPFDFDRLTRVRHIFKHDVLCDTIH